MILQVEYIWEQHKENDMAITKSEILTLIETYKTEAVTNLSDVMTDGDIDVVADKMKLNQAIACLTRMEQVKAWVEDNL